MNTVTFEYKGHQVEIVLSPFAYVKIDGVGKGRPDSTSIKMAVYAKQLIDEMESEAEYENNPHI